jgi:hypothetical protein
MAGRKFCGYPVISFPSVTQVLPSAILQAVWYKRKTRHLIETAGFYLVAGARNHHYLRARGSCGVEVAGLAHSILKALTVEDGSNHLKLFWQAVA